MAGIPITRREYPTEKQQAIRAAVRSATGIANEANRSRLATIEDAQLFYDFLKDPAVHEPIYTLPRPLTLAAVRSFIADHLNQRDKGEGLLFLNCDADGAIRGYVDIEVWPQWAAGEMGGALAKANQSQGRGSAGVRLSFTWLFDVLGLELLCLTAAPDNFRTAKVLDGMDFRRMGEVISRRPDGSNRESLVWEVSRSEWDACLGR